MDQDIYNETLSATWREFGTIVISSFERHSIGDIVAATYDGSAAIPGTKLRVISIASPADMERQRKFLKATFPGICIPHSQNRPYFYFAEGID